MQERKSNTFLIYVDESADETHYAFGTFIVPIDRWSEVLIKINNFREYLFKEYNIAKESELHATKFTIGKGSNRISNNEKRMIAFQDIYKFIASLDMCYSINGISSNKKKCNTLFEYIANRINTFCEKMNAYAIIICDERDGKELVKRIRDLRNTNHVNSQYTKSTYNKPLSRIIDDPLFKNSKQSLFIQKADFIAYSLLRSEKPIERQDNRVKECFSILEPILVKEASKNDIRKLGIVRVWGK